MDPICILLIETCPEIIDMEILGEMMRKVGLQEFWMKIFYVFYGIKFS